jgi:hypothetical protein
MLWCSRLAVSRVRFASVLSLSERLCIPVEKEPFHVGQLSSRKHVQAIKLRSARACDPVFCSTGMSSSCRMPWRVSVCRLSNPAFVKTSFRPYPGAVQALAIAHLFLDGWTVRRHIVLLRSLVFISLFPPVAQRQPLEVAPTLDAHCTGCFWFQTLHQTPRAHIPTPAIHRTQTTLRIITPDFHTIPQYADTTQLENVTADHYYQQPRCFPDRMSDTRVASTTHSQSTAQWPTPLLVPAPPRLPHTAVLPWSPSPPLPRSCLS